MVIAEDIETEVLATMVVNNLRGVLKIAAVKTPGFGEQRKELLKDIAVLTGGIVISEENGYKLENTELEQLGKCEKLLVTKENTTIINGSGTKEDIQKRILQIKTEIAKSTSTYDKEKLQERLAKLTGGVAVVYVGAATELEMTEMKDRVDDALNATRSAIEEGIVPGGGVVFLRAIPALESLKEESEDENVGIAIIKKALDEPLKQIVLNAGLEPTEILQRVKEGIGDYGFNAKNEKYENLYATGIIDPVKVERLALENAASVAMMMLTTECVIAAKREKEKSPVAMMPEM